MLLEPTSARPWDICYWRHGSISCSGDVRTTSLPCPYAFKGATGDAQDSRRTKWEDKDDGYAPAAGSCGCGFYTAVSLTTAATGLAQHSGGGRPAHITCLSNTSPSSPFQTPSSPASLFLSLQPHAVSFLPSRGVLFHGKVVLLVKPVLDSDVRRARRSPPSRDPGGCGHVRSVSLSTNRAKAIHDRVSWRTSSTSAPLSIRSCTAYYTRDRVLARRYCKNVQLCVTGRKVDRCYLRRAWSHFTIFGKAAIVFPPNPSPIPYRS
ncbi:hypothetical protein B0H12DRAFT_167569 [Mycena haematopus]|nr:hypothetical protein B0H12DRAFT_167569 [Mycena haematopus]